MKRILSVAILSVLLITSFDAPAVFGCAIRSGDPWYKVDAQVINNPLSDVLGISFSRNGGLITFTNLGLKSNLYVASKDTDGIYPGYRESQRDYRPTEEIIGKDYDPNVQISIGDGLPKGIYTFRGGWDKSNIADQDTSDSGTVSLASALDSTDNYKTKQVARDGRPDDATIPEPDYQTMYVFYDGLRYNIDIVLSYTMNSSYIPDRTRKSCEGEGEALRTASTRRQIVTAAGLFWIISLTGLLVFGSIPTVLLIKSVKQKKRKVSKRKKTVKSNSNRARKK